MRIYLTHPLHGAKHAYAESEALADEKNGWVRQEETAPTVVATSPFVVDVESEDDSDEVPVLPAIVKNKPGPKPKAK